MKDSQSCSIDNITYFITVILFSLRHGQLEAMDWSPDGSHDITWALLLKAVTLAWSGITGLPSESYSSSSSSWSTMMACWTALKNVSYTWTHWTVCQQTEIIMLYNIAGKVGKHGQSSVICQNKIMQIHTYLQSITFWLYKHFIC